MKPLPVLLQKLQHLQEEKNKEIEILRNTIRDLEQRLNKGQDLPFKRRRFWLNDLKYFSVSNSASQNKNKIWRKYVLLKTLLSNIPKACILYVFKATLLLISIHNKKVQVL